MVNEDTPDPGKRKRETTDEFILLDSKNPESVQEFIESARKYYDELVRFTFSTGEVRVCTRYELDNMLKPNFLAMIPRINLPESK